jgi:hypothetical protein
VIASPSSAWTSGAAVFSAVGPMILFIAVAGALYVLYTKPETVPGHPVGPAERPVSYTRVPGQAQAAPAPVQAQAARAEGTAAAETSTSAAPGTSSDEAGETSPNEAAGTEDAE